MKCDRCKYNNPTGSKKCINCGKELPEEENPTVFTIIIQESNKKKIKNRKENDYYLTEYRGPTINPPPKLKKGKKLWIAGILSILIVGFGHFYLKNYKRGLSFLLIQIISGLLYTKIEIFLCLALFNYIYQILDVILFYKKNYEN